ncbi:MAG TPA: hypothetical protein VF755_29750 [Catenuloplanes sp.]
MRKRSAIAGATAVAMVAGFGAFLGLRDWDLPLGLPLPARPGCTVGIDQSQVSLNPEQMANAATIAAVGVRSKMSERAVVVALATALQESKLENIPGGDRDSVGLFQQRPSQGWGTPEQIRDPRYAAGKFYVGLKKVRGWEKMRVTDAAQRVQRSAFPEAYEKWADDSSVLAKALVGRAPGAVACTLTGEPAARGAAATTALTAGLRLDWDQAATTMPAPAVGLAVPVADDRIGWRYAHWLVAHATWRGVERVRFADQEWKAASGGWTRVDPQRAAGTRQVIAEVFRDREP